MVHCLLGKTYELLGEHEKAKTSYERAVKLQPQSVAAQYGLAVACAKLGLEDQSQRAMEQYQKLQAENSKSQRSKRDVVFDASRSRKILAMTCSDASTVYIRSGMPARAEPLLRRGVKADPEYTGCRIQLVQLLCLADRVPEAVPIMRELVAIEPANANFHLRLAMIYDRLARLDEARSEAKKSLELAPGDEECRRFLEQLQTKK